jgi:hypothetical protein
VREADFDEFFGSLLAGTWYLTLVGVVDGFSRNGSQKRDLFTFLWQSASHQLTNDLFAKFDEIRPWRQILESSFDAQDIHLE